MELILDLSLVLMKLRIPIPIPVGAFVILLVGGLIALAIESAEKRSNRSLGGLTTLVMVITIALALSIGITEVAGRGSTPDLIGATILSLAVGGLLVWGGILLLRKIGKDSPGWRLLPMFFGLAVAIVMIVTA